MKIKLTMLVKLLIFIILINVDVAYASNSTQNLSWVVLPTLNLLLFCYVFYKVISPLILKAWKERASFISSQSKKAANDLQSAKKSLEEIELRFSHLETELQTLRKGIISLAETEASSIINDGGSRLTKMTEDSQARLESQAKAIKAKLVNELLEKVIIESVDQISGKVDEEYDKDLRKQSLANCLKMQWPLIATKAK
jgi:F0F1-type ATP synthase membrane subunit b/b'